MSSSDSPFVSILVPCRNEGAYLEACLDSIQRTAYPGNRIEILVIDGMSDDSTRDIIARHAAEDHRIRLLDNPRRIVPVALNIGIRAARGTVIVRMDAHATYPPEYVPRLVAALIETRADNVGGVIVTHPGADTIVARAIAVAMSDSFGVGNAFHRIGTRSRRWVDTVPFGCWPRHVFDRVGVFDERLVRNQDDEFNSRLIRHGGRILLLPDVVSHYHARSRRGQLARMLFQYGYFKPLAATRARRIMRVRHFVPPLFCISLAVTAIASFAFPIARLGLAAILLAYGTALFAATARTNAAHGFRVAATITTVFPIMHISYGLGLLMGLPALLHGNGPADPLSVPITRAGNGARSGGARSRSPHPTWEPGPGASSAHPDRTPR